MALHERQQGQGNFLTPKHGSLVLESSEPKDGYEEITVDNPQDVKPDGTLGKVTKYIKRFQAVDGKIIKLEWYDRESGTFRFRGLKIHLRDKDEFYQIDLGFGKRHFDYFTKVMENIDYTQPIEFVAWKDKQNPRQTAFAAKQFGDFIQWRYTRDNMGDCPPATKDELGNWDFRDQKIWLFKKLRDEIIPKVAELNAFDEPQEEYAPEDESPVRKAALAATAATEQARRDKDIAPDMAVVLKEPSMPPFDPTQLEAPPETDVDIPW